MKKVSLLLLFCGMLLGRSTAQGQSGDFDQLARLRKGDLQYSVYVIAQTIDQLLSTENGRREALSVLHCNGITRVYLEVYRSGLTISPERLKQCVSFFKENGFEVIGGIATVPGEGFGVKQEGPLAWLNFQNPKTQADLKRVIEQSAPCFDRFIIDDFLCTGDTSLESKLAKGDRSWSDYRRSLMTSLAKKIFIEPAKAKNPAIQMIIKYPQSYDRFHLFGYDVATEPALFDGVWVGTESRGQYTQRYGFVQPYEGFINYRWIATTAGAKIGGAWFDHGDCNEIDFIEQAYQSVLAGAKELVFFNFDSFITGHPGHHLLRQDFEKLANLAHTVAQHPVVGVTGYKPANSDAGGDLYLFDYMGMFGLSFIPVSQYPDGSKSIFLSTQAAADRDILAKIRKSLKLGAKIVMTTGFLANAPDGEKLARLAGVHWPLQRLSTTTSTVLVNNQSEPIKFPLTTDFLLKADQAEVLLEATKESPFLTQKGTVFVLNSHTFSQQDFDAVGEVLLCPRQIGLLELPRPWMNRLRAAFQLADQPVLDAPSRVTIQQLDNGEMVVHNYNQEQCVIKLSFPFQKICLDGFTQQTIEAGDSEISLKLPPRGRIWIKPGTKH